MNEAPEADYNWHCQGLTCDFRDASEDDDGRVVAWSWNFGDGRSSTLQSPTHTYSSPGEYEVTLTVRDDDGATDQSVAHVDVEAPPPPPPGGTETTITGDAPDPSDPGALVTVSFTVTASSGTPTGTVVVSDERGGGCTGSAPSGNCTYTPAGTGTRTITARYEGSASFRGSSGAAEHTVNEPPPPPPASTTTTITSDNPDPSIPGEQITVTFTVTSASGTPTGNVQVSDANGGGCSGNAPSDSCTYTPSGTGERTITATYEGNSSFEGSADTEVHTVNETPPPPAETETEILSVEPEDEAEVGESVLVEFRVESKNDDRVPSGTVAVTVRERPGTESCTGTLDANGEGFCRVTLTTPGSIHLVAAYLGNAVFSASSDEESYDVEED
jgi:large repetitive protein